MPRAKTKIKQVRKKQNKRCDLVCPGAGPGVKRTVPRESRRHGAARRDPDGPADVPGACAHSEQTLAADFPALAAG